MTPYADALEGAVARRVGLLSGLRTFVDSRRTRAVLDEEFPVFASGTGVDLVGVRALQLVERGRIVAVWPFEGNEATLGLDLRNDPRPVIGGDVRRALASGQVTVTGPIELVQGGTGLLVRQRLAQRTGFPELVAIILDVPTLVAEAGLRDSTPGLHLELLDRDGKWFGGAPVGSAVVPETLVVQVADGDWRLLGAPVAGWDASIAEWRRSLLGALLLVVLLAGLVGYVLGTRQDRLSAEADEAASRLDLALEAGGMGMWEYEVATGRLDWNDGAARILGFVSRDEADPLARLFRTMHRDDRARMAEAMRAVQAGERGGYVEETRLLDADGAVRRVLIIAEVARDESGAPTRIFGIVSDATARHQLQERLRSVQRLEAVGRLAGGVAHDFNNLLTAIGGFAELARDRAGELPPGDAEIVRDDITHVIATAERGAALTRQLLAFSRRSANAPQRVELPSALAELTPMLQRLAGDGVTVRCECASETPPVWVDPGQLTQVVLNLVVNARDAMPEGGTVTLRACPLAAVAPSRPVDAPPGDWTCLEVTDTGVGMSAAVRQRIFEPYFTTKEFGRGTGLGLAVVYGAVESAQGVITVDSVEGQGTTFRLYFPPMAREAAA